MTTSNKVLIQVGEEIIELKGDEKEAFLARVQEDVAKEVAEENEKQAAKVAKAALLERLGITEEEASLLLG
jgi:hypothetical protein